MILGAVERVGDDPLHHSPLVWPDHTVADQPRMDPPARRRGQPETAHRSRAESEGGGAAEVDVSEVVGGGSWPERLLVGAPIIGSKLPDPGLLVSPYNWQDTGHAVGA